MKKVIAVLLLSSASLLGCETLPNSSQPQPQPKPAVLLNGSATTGPSLLERYESSKAKFEKSLEKARR